jgi:hypothetical protein
VLGFAKGKRVHALRVRVDAELLAQGMGFVSGKLQRYRELRG